jgi:hypothetical protein
LAVCGEYYFVTEIPSMTDSPTRTFFPQQKFQLRSRLPEKAGL